MNIRIRVHYTWILVFALVTAIVTTQFSEDYPLRQRIILGVVVALLYLAAAVIRELIIRLAVFYKEVPARKITMFAFGGLYLDKRDRIIPPQWRLLYLARFLSNLVIAVIFYGLYATLINAGNSMLAGMAQWLTYIFFLLFLLNFVPAYPLDAGEILRILLWRSSGDYYKATRIASLIGVAAGLFLIFAGVLVFIITQQWSISLVTVCIGWFIQIAASYVRGQLKTLVLLQKTTAQDIMVKDFPASSGQLNIGTLIRESILVKGWTYVIVMDSTHFAGLLTLSQIKSVPVKGWNSTTLNDCLTPSDRLLTARPQQTADTLLEEMNLRKIDYMPVLEDDHVTGVVTRDALMDLVKIRAWFGV